MRRVEDLHYLRTDFPPTLELDAMAIWKKLFGADEDAQKVDYYQEGLSLLREGRFHEALTSFRLALKEAPGDTVVLQQIAIVYTRIGMTEEASKTYRHVLQKDPSAAGAHYGLAYLLLRQGGEREAIQHLEAFLRDPPRGADAREHVSHARATLAQLTGQADSDAHRTGSLFHPDDE